MVLFLRHQVPFKLDCLLFLEFLLPPFQASDSQNFRATKNTPSDRPSQNTTISALSSRIPLLLRTQPPVSKPLLCRTVYPAPCICTYLPSVCILQPVRPLQPHRPSCTFLQLPERRAVRTRHSARPKRCRTEYSTLVNTSRSFWDSLAPAPTKPPVFHPPGKQLQPVCPSPQQHVILRLALFLDVLDVSRLSWKSPRLWRRMSASPLPLPRPTSRRRVTR